LNNTHYLPLQRSRASIFVQFPLQNNCRGQVCLFFIEVRFFMTVVKSNAPRAEKSIKGKNSFTGDYELN
jgi:hypothetical protein